jgi:hypothetical protein
MASLTSFFFSHRVWFFMQTEKFKSPQNATETNQMLKGLKNVCMHEDTHEIIYLANSSDLLRLLIDLDMVQLYPRVKQLVYSDLVFTD